MLAENSSAPGTDNACGVSARAWYALAVRSNHEQSVATRLERIGLECYLPQYMVRRQWSDRVRTRPQALFPGYIFCSSDMAGLAQAAELASVVSALPSNLSPLAVSDEDIATIKRLIGSGLTVEPHTPALGERVTIAAGPLAGISGVVTRVGRARLVVNIANLHGRAIAVELDAAGLLSVNESRNSYHY